MEELKDKIAVITGSTRGFGLAIAKAYGEAGAVVIVSSRTKKAVDNSVDMLKTAGFRAGGHVCDVAHLDQVKALQQYVLDTFGGVDIWVNNAGIAGPYGPTIHLDPEVFEAVTRINVLGTYHGSLVAMRHFLAEGHGTLINVLGRGARRPTPFQNAYASSKAWIKSFTLALAQEYEEHGVRVLAYNPGMMFTDLLLDVEVIEGYRERLDVFETIVRMWAQDPRVPARTMVRLAAGSAGRSGAVVREMRLPTMIWGALREGLRRLFHRETEPLDMEIETTPAAFRLEDPQDQKR